MRILVHTIFYAPELTGVAKYTSELCEWLAAQGHDVCVVAPPPYYPQWRVQTPYRPYRYKKETIAGVRVHRCPIWLPRRPGGLGRILYALSFALSSAPAMCAEAFAGVDLVFVIEPSLLNAAIGLPLARLAGAAAWLHIQDFEVDLAYSLGQLRMGRALIESVESWILKRFDKVSSITRGMLDNAARKGVRRDKLYLLPNWFDPAAIQPLRASPLRAELAIPEDSIVALYAGSLGAKQGIEGVIEAARLLTGERNLLFVISGDGVMAERLRRQADNAANVRFVPLQPADRLNDLLNLADIHLLPQHAAASGAVMPSKLIGMLASGRPIVATVEPGSETGKLIEGCGALAKPGDARDLASAILNLANDPERRQDLGNAARRRALDLFRQDVILPQLTRELDRRAVAVLNPA